jgi:hypothetical protein
MISTWQGGSMKLFLFVLLAWILLYPDPFLQAQDYEWFWAVTPDSDYQMDTWDMASDSQGNQYILGHFAYSATFGTTTLTSTSGGLFVAKLDENGNWLWASGADLFSSASYDGSIVVDGTGNVFVTGSFSNSVIFGTTTLTSIGSLDIYAAKLDAIGNWLWAVRAGGTDADYCSGTAAGNSGIYISGSFRGTTSFGNISLTGDINVDYMYCARLDSAGNWLAAVCASAEYGNCVCLDGSGNVYVAGKFYPPADFGSFTNIWGDVYIAKLDANLNWLWVRGGSVYDCGWLALAVDATGHSYLTGSFKGSANLGDGLTSYNSSYFDIFVAKLDSNGQDWLWGRSAGGAGDDVGRDITPDDLGGAYVTGSFKGTFYFGTHPVTAAGIHNSSDIFVAKLDSGGTWQWAKTAGSEYDDSGLCIEVDTSLNAFISGEFSTYALFSPFGYVSHGSGASTCVFTAELGIIIPRSPDNLLITKNGNDILLDWDAVTEYTNGQPLTPNYYLVYGSSVPAGPFSLLGLSVGTSYPDPGAALSFSKRFYRITAIRN